MKLTYAKKAAFSGVITALCIALMFSSAIFPLLSYTLPALCGLVLMVTSLTVGEKYAYIAYAATAILSIFFVPDKECMLLFISFFGYYPVLKSRLDSLKFTVLKYVLKFGIFNISIITTQALLFKVFGIEIFAAEFIGKWAILLLIALINVFFVIFDRVLYLFEKIYRLNGKKHLLKF